MLSNSSKFVLTVKLTYLWNLFALTKLNKIILIVVGSVEFHMIAIVSVCVFEFEFEFIVES